MAAGTRWTLGGGVAVITGAASGIGAALALCLARRGVNLALADVNAAGLDVVVQATRARAVQVSGHVLDVSSADAVAALPQAVLAVHGKVTMLVNNAGVALGGTFEQVDAADFDWLMSVNFHGPVRLVRAFLPILSRERAAQIVNVSSIFGIVAPPGQTAYCASKFALRGFSESLRHELEAAGSPVGVTLVHPGGVRTAIAESARLPKGAAGEQIARERAAWRSVLTLPPETAAERITLAIERRELRVLVGTDAKQAAFLHRIMPVGYWKLMARDIARRIGRQADAA